MTGPSAVEGWHEKLAFLEAEEVKEYDPAAKFKLRKEIAEAKSQIAEHEGRRPAPPQRIAPSRLTHVAGELVGREAEIDRLEATWQEPKINVMTLVAWGGVGKTSLVATWAAGLAERHFDGADYFDWSFYSQGMREQGGVSADTFVAEALRFFGDPELAASAASGWDKGARLAQLLAGRRALLILDGLEPLQYPPGPLTGQLKDPAVTSLLKGLAQANAGLCLVTTREKVSDLSRYRKGTVLEYELERLTPSAGTQLLKVLGVVGRGSEMADLVEEVSGHALTLNLLGTYLARAHWGDIRRRDRIDFQEADRMVQGGHAFKAMEAYERWLEEGGDQGQRQLAILRLLGLFDRPADAELLAMLCRPPAIRGLTDALVAISIEDWNIACSRLAACHLVVLLSHSSSTAEPFSGRCGGLDAHPLLREFFARRLREHQSEAWLAAHGRLYEHLQITTEYRPDTLEGLQPLYQAVTHGCLAGRHRKARAEVYRDRILRGTGAGGFYSTTQLGALGADLGAVASFFELPWGQVSPALTEEAQAWLLNQAAFLLRALGRLSEALEPMRAGLRMRVQQKVWRSAAIIASNLSELELALGDLSSAVRDGEQAVLFSERSGDDRWRIAIRTTEADALHQAGHHAEALELFREAERIQSERPVEYPQLDFLPGFRLYDLLLAGTERAAWRGGEEEEVKLEESKRAIRDVEARIWRSRVWPRAAELSPLATALEHLTIGRARLYRTILERAETGSASLKIEQAVAGLRRAGQQQLAPLGLLTRAWLRSLLGDTLGARADLDESQEIAERGPMPLYLADVHLHRARLFRDRPELAAARELIEEHGYWRRKEELEDAEATANNW